MQLELGKPEDLRKLRTYGDSSVSAVLVSGCLEYADGLIGHVRELYRVTRHLGIVCVLAPYAHSAAFAGHPASRTAFNEYTPQAFTGVAYRYSSGFPRELPTVSAPLLRDGASLDLRLLRMEYFYFPPFHDRLYSDADREHLRVTQWNVVSHILYHFAPVKQPVDPGELHRLATGPLPEPAAVRTLRHSHPQAVVLGTDGFTLAPVSGTEPVPGKPLAAESEGAPTFDSDDDYGLPIDSDGDYALPSPSRRRPPRRRAASRSPDGKGRTRKR